MSGSTGGPGGGAGRLLWLGAQFAFATVAAVLLGMSAGTERYLVVGLLLGGAAVLLSALDWRRHLVPLIFAYVCVEGFVSLYFSGNKVALLIKDFLIVIAYLSFLAEVVATQRFVFFRSILVPMLVLALLGVVEIFNPAPNHTILVGVVGFKILCFYMPLVFLGYYCFETIADLRRFLGYLLALSVPVIMVAAWQYMGGETTLTRMGPGFNKAVIFSTGSAYGEHLRAIGTFSSPGMLASFGYCTVAAGLIYHGIAESQRQKNLCMIALLLAAVMLLVSGTRGAMLGTAMTVGATLLLLGRYRQLAGSMVLAFAAVVLVAGFLGEAVLGRLETLLDPAVYLSRVNLPVKGLFAALAKAPLGWGLGCASVGARHVAPGGKIAFLGEQYLTKLVYEMGWFGVASFIWMTGAAMAQGLRSYRRCVTPAAKWATGCLAVFVTAQLLLGLEGSALDTIPLNVYFWFFMGVMLKAPEMKAAVVVEPAARPRPWPRFGGAGSG